MIDDSGEDLQQQGDALLAAAGLPLGQGPLVFVNGEKYNLQQYGTLDRIVTTSQDQQLHTIQRDTYYGRLRDGDNVLDHFMSLPGVVKRLPLAALADARRFVSLHSKEEHALPLGEWKERGWGWRRLISFPLATTPNSDLAAALHQHLLYMAKPGTEFDVKVRELSLTRSSQEIVSCTHPSPFPSR